MSLIEKISETEDFEDAKSLRLFEKIDNIKSKGYLTKKQAIEILKWKSPRPLRYYELNSDYDFKETTEFAFKSKDEKIKINVLTALNGVRFPSASAILMFYDKINYPVIDIRVWRQLYQAGLVNTNARGRGFTLKQWEMYVKLIREIASQLRLTARQVEKRVFDIDIHEQKGNLY